MTTRLPLVCTLAAFLAVLGCGHHDPKDKKAPAGKDDHGHTHEDGPHGGVICEWGEDEYDLEFTVDHKAQEATVYVYDGKQKAPKPIKAEKISLMLAIKPPVTFDLVAKPQEGDPAGSCSRFVGKHAALAEDRKFAGTLSATLDGKQFNADFKETSHAGHKH